MEDIDGYCWDMVDKFYFYADPKQLDDSKKQPFSIAKKAVLSTN
ncbi:hypothetical protein [Paenibacillus sp. CFBP13512]|nr:hypothetical protein [Paenibacillus sp. CFBP13512]